MGSSDIEEDQFVDTLIAIYFAKLDRVTSIPEFQKINSFDSTTIFDIETGYDAFG